MDPQNSIVVRVKSPNNEEPQPEMPLPTLTFRPKRSRSEPVEPNKRVCAAHEESAPKEEGKEEQIQDEDKTFYPTQTKHLIVLTGHPSCDKEIVGRDLASRFEKVRFIQADQLLDSVQPGNYELDHLLTSIERLRQQVQAAFEDPESSIVVIACLMDAYQSRVRIALLGGSLHYENFKMQVWYLKPDCGKEFWEYLNKLPTRTDSEGECWLVVTDEIWNHLSWEKGLPPGRELMQRVRKFKTFLIGSTSSDWLLEQTRNRIEYLLNSDTQA